MTGERGALDHDDILRHGFEEFRAFVNPLIAQRAEAAREPTYLLGTRDGALVDRDGGEVEDFYGPQAFGHRNPHVGEALIRFLQSGIPSWYPSRVNPFSGRLARELCARSGHVYDNVYFGCNGTDANEAAIKLARAVTGRPRILGLASAYHGCSYGSLALMECGMMREPFAPHLPGGELIPFDDVDALAAALAPGDVAAVFVEPIQGEGGVRPLSDAYVEALGALTAEHGTLLVADEVQTGLGRTGRGFLASEGWPRRPDVVCLAKHLGGGLTALSATLTHRRLFERAYGANFATAEAHNSTMGCNALSAVAGLATLELLTDAVIADNRERGARFKRQLSDALLSSPIVAEVRGEGMMLGIKLTDPEHPWLSFEHFGMEDLGGQSLMAPLFCMRLYQKGFFCFTAGHDWTVCRVQPRFDIPTERLEAFTDACVDAVRFIEDLV